MVDVSETKLRKTAIFIPSSFVIMILQLSYPQDGLISLASALHFVLYIIYIIFILKKIDHPIIFAAIALFMYTYFPLLDGVDYGIFSQFSLTGGYNIYAFAVFSFVFGVFISSLIPDRVSYPVMGSAYSELELSIAAAISSLLSIVLCSIYAFRFGAVGMGSVDYAESFAQRLESGSGILFLSIPFAIAAVSITFSRPKIGLFGAALSCGAFVILFIVLGQRKIIIAPLMIYAASRVRVRSLNSVIVFISGIAVSVVLFGYLGYLRIENRALVDTLAVENMVGYWNKIGSYISGETPVIYATAAAAYDGFISPLPYASDYFFSWAMAIPRFLAPLDFSPVNVRFSIALTPRFAEAGGGWGFSYYGEAYLVGNYVGVFVATVFIVIIFRVISSLAWPAGRNGYYYALSITGVYYALWFQRNAFSYFFKEFLVQQSFTLAICLFFARLAVNITKQRRA